jgi:hypothetical protein
VRGAVVIGGLVWIAGAVILCVIDRCTTDSEPKDGASILWPITLGIILPLFLALRWWDRRQRNQP